MIADADLDLLQAYLDGTLSQAGQQALEDRLRDDPVLAESLVCLSREEAILKEWACASRAAEAVGETCQPLVLGGARFRRALRVVSGAAALVALGVFSWTIFPGRHEMAEAPAVARVEEVHGEVFVVSESGHPVPAKSGQGLAYGQKLRTLGEDSFAVLAFPDRSRLELGADTTVRLNPSESSQGSGREVYLEQGHVAAGVHPSNDQPMVVQTLHAEAVVSGTRSNVASLRDETRVEPEKGRVHVKRKSDGRSVDVRPGEYAVAGPNRQLTPKRAPARLAEVQTIPLGNELAFSASFSPDASTLAAGCSDGSIKLWDVATGVLRQVIRAHTKAVRAVAFSPVGPLLVSGNEEKVLKFWDPITGEELAARQTGKARIDCLAFSPDGALLVTAGNRGKDRPDVLFWDVAQRKEIASLTAQQGSTAAIAFSPDGRTLATSGRDGTVKLWDLGTRQLRQTLVGHTGRVNALAFSPDGTLLASGGADRMVRLWDTATGTERPPLTGQAGEIRGLAFAPDGKTLVSSDSDLILWDMPTGRQRLKFRAHRRAIAALCFHPDGKLLATVGWDKMIRLWDTTRMAR